VTDDSAPRPERNASPANTSVTPGGDNWDDHWATFGDPALGNPANDYRNRLILHFLGTPNRDTTILDIGSGQGQLGILLQTNYPDTRVVGIEYSSEGVHRATLAARSAGVDAHFVQRDLLKPASDVPLLDDVPEASLAVCSEVLEHVDDPELLLRNAAEYLRPDCRVVITVPGGPMSALDRYIGHRMHYTPATLRALLERSGFVVERTERAGFPFFNLYRLLIVARGRQLIEDVKSTTSSQPSKLQTLIARFFDLVFHWNLDRSPFGWQIVGIAMPSPAKESRKV
jgi:SAM-dependent methyltransferase